MSNTLLKPYTNLERGKFICDNSDLRFEETETALFALEDNEMIVDGEPVINPDYEQEQFESVKSSKLKEAETKCTEKRYSQFFTVELQGQECEFDTTEKTQSDLETAGIFINSTGGVYPDWVTNNGVKLDLTAEDMIIIFQAFFPLVSPLYIKQLAYIEQINACETMEELENIEITYDFAPSSEEEKEQSEETEEVTEENSGTEEPELTDEEITENNSEE